MATLDELGKALTNADAAGDVDAARALAGEITKMRQSALAPKGSMAKFRLTDPTGAEYEVDAPDEHQAVAGLKQVTAAPKKVTLNIEGRRVTVDDSFLKLSPEQQNSAVDEIHKALPKPVTDAALLKQLNAPDPIHIGAPDGSVVEFPAGTSDETIKSAMGKAYPAPAGKRVTDPALLAALNGTTPPAAAPTEPKGMLQTVREAIHAPTRALENGVMLGLGDRARAVIDSALSGGGYGEHLKNEQGETEQFAKAHPIAAPVLEATGGVIAPIGVLGAAAQGATLGTKTLLGAGAGGGIGAVQGAFGSKDWTDVPQLVKDTAVGGILGGALGGVMPAAGGAAGRVYGALTNAITGKVDGMSRAAGGHLVRAVEADGPAAVQARVAELGPDAMLADAGPALLGKAQGASLNSDEGRSVLQTALTTRNEGTNARIQRDVNQALGPAEDPQIVTDSIRAHRSAVDNVNYPAALENAPDVRTAHILTQIDDMLPRSVGNEHRALTNLRAMMMTTERRPLLDAQGHPQYDNMGRQRWQEVPVSQNDAEVLHKVKQELDNVIEYDAPGLGVPAGALTRQQGVLRHMRGQVNQALEEQVPGYANANAVSAALARRGEAVQNGTQYLGSGKTTPSPERFAADFEPLSQGEKIAFAKGSRGEVNRVLGTKANDLQALRGELQGEGGWNTDKLATVHGVPETNDLIASVERNLKFRDTHQKVVEGSQTDLRNAARKEMKPDPSTETPLFNPNSTLTGMLATVGKKTTQKVVDALTQSDPTRHYGEVARALTEQGSARDARLLAIVNAINSRQGNVEGAKTAGNAGAVVAALLGNSAADRLYVGPSRRQQQ
ncbi:hypothetical protein [Bradyrhizobium sp. BWC-3-1]|uniref:hypothetical protein n=1 Tax=Bradyrhizobium sp. BWC-3-1 TaxID=3080012 RepID=UPI00293E9949|nr:hypothetical protein [Bradyrhizobium sp. BWC-3-1]WOH58528.1 hypothetical protein RX329_41690 [Bradyrhizobium sp. BWC-3-1]